MEYIILTIIAVVAIYLIYFRDSSKTNGNSQPTQLIEKPRVDIDMVPLEMHGLNVRSRIRDDEWKKICTIIHKQATKFSQYKCSQCGDNGKMQGFSHPVECHEVWEFNEPKRVQTLIGMVSICPYCHKAKHFGLADKLGFGGKVREHMAKHNNWSRSQVEDYIRESKRVVVSKSGMQYKLSLTYLNRPEFYFLQTKFTEDEANNCNPSIKY